LTVVYLSSAISAPTFAQFRRNCARAAGRASSAGRRLRDPLPRRERSRKARARALLGRVAPARRGDRRALRRGLPAPARSGRKDEPRCGARDRVRASTGDPGRHVGEGAPSRCPRDPQEASGMSRKRGSFGKFQRERKEKERRERQAADTRTAAQKAADRWPDEDEDRSE
jgi:hypothetical protein